MATAVYGIFLLDCRVSTNSSNRKMVYAVVSESRGWHLGFWEVLSRTYMSLPLGHRERATKQWILELKCPRFWGAISAAFGRCVLLPYRVGV